jgi:hypothetical protein
MRSCPDVQSRIFEQGVSMNERDEPAVIVRTFPTRSEAELAQSVLAGSGIASVVAADDAGGAYPFLLAGGARLLVDEADAEAAAAILDGGQDEPQS